MRYLTLRTGKPPEYNAANGYDSIMLISSVVKKCNENVECMINETSNIKNFEGVSGRITFVSGVADKYVYFKIIKDGEFAEYEE